MFYFYEFIGKNLTLFDNKGKKYSKTEHVNNAIGLIYTYLQFKC
jgi:hypothetical protein